MEGKREALITWLETRFGALPEVARTRIEKLVFKELDEAIRKSAMADSLEATGLLKPKHRSSRTKKNGKK
jgi:hypothetical protein